MTTHLDAKKIFSELSLHRIEENLTLSVFSQAGAFGYSWTEEGGAYVQAATLAQTWFAAWFTGGVESLQRGGASLHAAPWLSARPAAHQWRPAHQNRGAVERWTGHDAEDWDAGWRWLGLDHGLLSVFAYTHVFFFVRMNLKMRTPVVLRIYRRVWWERCLWGSQAKFSLYWVTSPWMWPWEPPVPSCRSVTLISAVGHPQAIQDVDEFVCSWEQI